MDEKLFLQYSRKKEAVLKELEPIFSAFGINDWDYKINTETWSEKLCVNGTEIGCTGNSVEAVVDEMIAYIFVTRYCQHRNLGAFHKQTLNHIKQHWS